MLRGGGTIYISRKMIQKKIYLRIFFFVPFSLLNLLGARIFKQIDWNVCSKIMRTGIPFSKAKAVSRPCPQGVYNFTSFFLLSFVYTQILYNSSLCSLSLSLWLWLWEKFWYFWTSYGALSLFVFTIFIFFIKYEHDTMSKFNRIVTNSYNYL